METIEKRYDIACQTLKTLEESLIILHAPEYQAIRDTLRDSVIQRFEYSIDTFWKFIKLYLQEVMKVDIEGVTPRLILRNAMDAKLISQTEFDQLLSCLTDRNLTSHTYNEDLAQVVLSKIEVYYQLMDCVLKRVKL